MLKWLLHPIESYNLRRVNKAWDAYEAGQAAGYAEGYSNGYSDAEEENNLEVQQK